MTGSGWQCAAAALSAGRGNSGRPGWVSTAQPSLPPKARGPSRKLNPSWTRQPDRRRITVAASGWSPPSSTDLSDSHTSLSTPTTAEQVEGCSDRQQKDPMLSIARRRVTVGSATYRGRHGATGPRRRARRDGGQRASRGRARRRARARTGARREDCGAEPGTVDGRQRDLPVRHGATHADIRRRARR